MNNDNKPNITFVLPDGLTLSGAVTWSVELSRQLAELNQPVVLLKHPNFSGLRTKASIPSGVKVVNCRSRANPYSLYLSESDVAEYQAAYRLVKPSVIIPNWSPGAFAACTQMSMQEPESLRVISFAHSDERDYYELLHYYEPIIHCFVAVSQEIAANLREILPHRKDDILVRPYAVNVCRSLDRTYSAQNEPIRLIYAGRIIERQKRVSDLIRLAEALEKNAVDFHLRIVGDGRDKGLLLERLSRLDKNTRQRVSIVKKRPFDQMPETWKLADVCVLVSEYEGTSISMLEAMAQGCVPVVTEVSGTSAVVHHETNGFVVPVGDISSMAQIIRALDCDRQKLATLGAEAHSTIVNQFSYNDYVQWFMEIVDQVWGQKPRPWPAARPIIYHYEWRDAFQQLSLDDLSGEVIARQISIRKIIRIVGFKVGTKPGLRWLNRFRGLAKQFLGG